ncbi:lipase [Vibrio sp. Of7-15]|uniref:alpha/beta hydrolase-fold protein n=1 Tax=Vibrio sp. Of7-15 TaxID=2724879 RepID=UPI001EF2ACC0|nr:alpha/beta hydrolase-fold protein [Vibrio sp. Of7-15]MCG7498335.1 lipase [Vibrio sp. Of7-15]
MQTRYKYPAIILWAFSLSGCNIEEEQTQQEVSVYIPFSTESLPKPNDGYGYDDDGTLSVPSEPIAYSSDSVSFYQSYETSFGALDGWGLCTEPLMIPIASIDSPQRYDLEASSLTGHVMLIDKTTSTVVDASVSADGSNIEIACSSALKSGSTYYVVVSNGVTTQFGQPIKADSRFLTLQETEDEHLTPKEIDIKNQINAAKRAYSDVGGLGDVVYAAQFKTQDSYAVLEAIRGNNISASLGGLSHNTEGSKEDYELYQAPLTLPNYLPFTVDDKDNCEVDEFDPINKCPALYEWMQPADGGTHLTSGNPLPASEPLQLTADIYAPAGWDPSTPLPVVMFIHGVTADKGAASLMVKDYVAPKGNNQPYLVVAIDMPYHGERIMYDKYDNEISAKKDKSFFINITSPLTLRGNLHQSVSDFLSLRYALNNASWANSNEVHLIGHSLGGIMSVMVTEMTQGIPELALTTANFVVPGQGLVNLTLSSNDLGPETTAAIKGSPDIQRGIAETVVPSSCQATNSNEECITALRLFKAESDENLLTVTQLEDDIYDLILPGLKQGVQWSIDSSEPANLNQRQVQANQLTLLLEAVGNCGATCEVGEYLPDFVIPNYAENNVRTGTDPLVSDLGLDVLRAAHEDQNGIRGVLRTTTGGHGTYLFPYEGPMDDSGEPGFPDKDILIEVLGATGMQQKAVASMVRSQGKEVAISDRDLVHIETEEVN